MERSRPSVQLLRLMAALSLYFSLLYLSMSVLGGSGSALDKTFNITTFDNSSILLLKESAVLNSSRLQLTSDNASIIARALYNGLVPILQVTTAAGCQAASFNVQFSFRIFNYNSVCHGDGLAFTFLGSNIDFAVLKGAGEDMALNYTGEPKVGSLIVVFDTYPNSYDPPERFVGIREKFLNPPVANQTTTILDDFNQTTKYAWLDYDGASETLKVYLDKNESKPATPLLIYERSLCELLRPSDCPACQSITEAYVGFTAGTGSCADFHEIHSWSFQSNFPESSPPPPPPSPPPPPPPSPPAPPPPSSGENIPLLVGTITGSIVVVISLLALIGCCCFHRYRKKGVRLEGQRVRRISLSAITVATKNFSQDNILGEGGYGIVYVGVKEDGEKWAVKRAINASIVSLPAFKQEVYIISQMSHTNIVQLLGYCDEGSEQILVYEFMENGSLRKLLHDEEGESLTFQQRVEIAIDVAEGLRYLHHYAGATVIHRDIKSDNILVNSKFKGKLADFGLLKDNPDHLIDVANDAEATGAQGYIKMNSRQHIDFSGKTKIAGTPGYMDPAYLKSSQVTTKSDVYSFGVVLFELITGRRALLKDDSAPEDDPTLDTLVHWIQPHLKQIESIVDPKMGGNYHEEALRKLTRLAIICTAKDPESRPTMEEVAQLLAQIKNTLLDKQAIDLNDDDERETADTSPRRFPITIGSSDSTFIVPMSQTVGPR